MWQLDPLFAEQRRDDFLREAETARRFREAGRQGGARRAVGQALIRMGTALNAETERVRA